MRLLLTTSTIWYGVGGFVGKIISFYRMACMCLIWLNMILFYWRLVLIMSLSLRDVMIWTLLHFPVSCWIEMASEKIGLLLVIFCQCWGSTNYSCFWMEMHGSVGFYLLIWRYMACCDIHSIVLQYRWECLLVGNWHRLQIYHL